MATIVDAIMAQDAGSTLVMDSAGQNGTSKGKKSAKSKKASARKIVTPDAIRKAVETISKGGYTLAWRLLTFGQQEGFSKKSSNGLDKGMTTMTDWIIAFFGEGNPEPHFAAKTAQAYWGTAVAWDSVGLTEAQARDYGMWFLNNSKSRLKFPEGASEDERDDVRDDILGQAKFCALQEAGRDKFMLWLNKV